MARDLRTVRARISGSETTMTEERRDEPRRRAYLGGKLVFNANKSVLDCLVRNLSSKGAQVNVETTLGVPDEVMLAIAGEPPRPCRVVWRRERQMGVEFI